MELKEIKLIEKRRKICDSLQLFTIEEVLTYYPIRYSQNELSRFESWQEKEKVFFAGTVVSHPTAFRYRENRSITRFQVEFDGQYLDVTLFNRPWASSQLDIGSTVVIEGKYEGRNKVTCSSYNTRPIEQQLQIQPIYALKEKITQKDIQAIMTKVYEQGASSLKEGVPLTLRLRYRLLAKAVALKYIHFPQSFEQIHQAYRTLKYEEFLKFHVALQSSQLENIKGKNKGKKMFNEDEVFGIANQLHYALTPDQFTAIRDIMNDLRSDTTMLRLVQGDVGSGKTLVAALAMAANCLAGYQSAMLAPTEILVKQHYKSLKQLFKMTKFKVEALYSGMPKIKKDDTLARLKNGEIHMIVGTHSLIQEEVGFKNLGLVVADEQHRFGVKQRQALREKGDKVDFLVMSATPIPRTLANTYYGDMEISTIHSMPQGRQPVQTYLIRQNSLISIMDALVQKLAEGRQIYVVCAAIEENENFKGRNVIDIYAQLSKAFEGKGRVGLLHGKMKAEEKQEVMEAFERNEIQILVTTTVVEVGVNVVNATTMVIYDAQRFGLSQLHQLRGRVQRGSYQGTCYLLTDSKEPTGLQRLQVLVDTTDGFKIAEEDLRLRGPGDILGVRQSGLPSFILGNLIEDTKIIEVAKQDAKWILDHAQQPEIATWLADFRASRWQD